MDHNKSTDEEPIIKQEIIDFSETEIAEEQLFEVKVEVNFEEELISEFNCENVRVKNEEIIQNCYENAEQLQETINIKQESSVDLGNFGISDIEHVPESDVGVSEKADEKRKPATNYPHNCKTCGRGFKFASGLNGHECSICDVCKKVFKAPNQLQVHYRIHTGLKPHKCCKCGKHFSTSSYLKDHVKIHGKEKEYKCDKCGKEFMQHQGLSRHIKIIHADIKPDKPWVCNFCGKRFLSPSHLKVHVRIHYKTVEVKNPFACKICGESFMQKSHKKCYELRGDDEWVNPFGCIWCEEAFPSWSDVKNHVITIHDEKQARKTNFDYLYRGKKCINKC